MKRVLLLLAAAAILAAADPVPVAVITRYPVQLETARAQFEALHGKGLIDLRLLSSHVRCTDFEGVRVVYFHDGSWPQQLNECAARALRLARDGTRFGASMGTILESQWRLASSPELASAAAYLKYGGPENLAEFLAVLYKAGGGARPLKIAKPREQAEEGIYHPKAPQPFTSLEAYLAWYRSAGTVAAGAPLAGITFFQSNYTYRDIAHIDALIAALERRGVGVVAAFGWPVRKLDTLLTADGRPVVKLLLSLNLLMPDQTAAAYFARYGLHTINLAITTESFAEWSASVRGLPPMRLATQIGTPERVGATEPILIATTERAAGQSASRLAPIAERVEMAAARAARWVALATKPNHDKRLAILYYNNPPGKASLGASYLNLIPSLVKVLERLQKEGYLVDTRIPDEEKLKRLLLLSGRNVGDYAPGELKALIEDGHVELLPMAEYEKWYAALPAEFRAFTEKTWGKPVQSKFMTVRSMGKAYFVIPGIRLGNIFLGPQPLRGSVEEAAGKTHDANFPVPHSYIACYLSYRNRLQADALLHMGRHGTVEWLPGKAVAQSGADTGEVLIGDLPHAYYYIVDGGGEFLQSKRRSSAVMVSHLTPMLVNAGLSPELRKLRDAAENRARVKNTNETLAREYENEIVNEVRRMKLDRQLGIDIEREQRSAIVARAEEFLHDAESQPIPLGMHTIGVKPPPDILREALEKFLESAFTSPKAAEARRNSKRWAAALVDGADESHLSGLPEKIRHEARLWLSNLEESPSQELKSLVEVLNGRYLPTGVSGDPLRTPDAVPTGRNMHDQDPRAFPTKSAWEVGMRMGKSLVDGWKEKHGEYPEKMSFVLWYGETSRHQGIAEAQALYLLGVEPVWNGRGHVDDVKLIPLAELGRPRVDVVLTISGLYRDGMPEKIRLLDKAAKLAAEAPDDNAVKRNVKRVAETLRSRGIDEDTARAASTARVFGPAPGAFGVGISGMMESSRDGGNPKLAGEAYLGRMNYAYTERGWGTQVDSNLREQLRGNQAVVHSRSTNLYGVLDNDDTYQFAGGLSAATTVAGGKEPSLLISNVRKPGEERVEEMKHFLTRELSTRLWNPKWIEGMKSAGYAGARQMAKEVEHLYGLRATAPSNVDESVWQHTFDVYVADKHKLGLDGYFARQNPHARQMMAARLLEVDRQGVYRFTEADRRLLVKAYVESVARNGVSCYVNACANRNLRDYVSTEARALSAVPRGTLEQWKEAMRRVAEPMRPAAPAMTASNKSAARPRQSAVKALFPKMRVFEISEGKLRIGEREFGWEWLLLMLSSMALGGILSTFQGRTQVWSCASLFTVPEQTPVHGGNPVDS